jgi:hypothetical protein
LTEEKLDSIGARLEHSPGKSLVKLVHQADISIFSARTATKLLKLCPHKITSSFIATKRLFYKDKFLQLVCPVSE